MKSVVCRLPYTVRVPMYVLTVIAAFIIERVFAVGTFAIKPFVTLVKTLITMAVIFIVIVAVLTFFWMSLTANSLFFFLN